MTNSYKLTVQNVKNYSFIISSFFLHGWLTANPSICQNVSSNADHSLTHHHHHHHQQQQQQQQQQQHHKFSKSNPIQYQHAPL